jgi:L-ascorbate metabolism protein UlaG (beta-lactamase superfamily)
MTHVDPKALITSRTEREKRIALSPRHRDGKFVNTRPTEQLRESPGLSMAYDFLAGGGARTPKSKLPIHDGTLAILGDAPSSSLRVTWLGHSTVLVEIEGVRLLTDPVWGQRASPLSFAGPKRFHPPPIALSSLPPVDAVLLSHDHYDHLDAPTIRALAAGQSPRFSGKFVTALGVGAELEKLGVAPHDIVELDWSDGTRVAGAGGAFVDVTSVPAQHFSGRNPLERNPTLWTGFVVAGARHRVFFSGDTGPTPEHKEIGAAFGPFDVALFEIGAFHPAWGDIHLGPNAALDAFSVVNARALLPVHWSTFDLALHPWEEPAETLFARATREGASIWTPLLGEPIDAATPPPTSPWWRALVKH